MDDKSILGVGKNEHDPSAIFGNGISDCLEFEDEITNEVCGFDRVPRPMISPRPATTEAKPSPLLLPRPAWKNNGTRLPIPQIGTMKSVFKNSSSSAFHVPKSNAEEKLENVPAWSPAPSMAISDHSSLSPLIVTYSPIRKQNCGRGWENISPISNIVSPLPSPKVPEREQSTGFFTPISDSTSTPFYTPVSQNISSDKSPESIGLKDDGTLFHTPAQSLSSSSPLIKASDKAKRISRWDVVNKVSDRDWREKSSLPGGRTNMRSSPWFNIGTKRNGPVELKKINRGNSENAVESLPQNLKGDPHRQAKVKTELCKFYIKGCDCPFGSKCNYAHGKIIVPHLHF